MAASKVKVAAVFLDLESSLQKARALIEQAGGTIYAASPPFPQCTFSSPRTYHASMER